MSNLVRGVLYATPLHRLGEWMRRRLAPSATQDLSARRDAVVSA